MWAYLNDVLKRSLAGETDWLLPSNWAEDYPESIRVYRQQERKDKQVSQREKRQKRRAQLEKSIKTAEAKASSLR